LRHDGSVFVRVFRTSTQALELLTAYVLVVALVTCDLYPEPGVATRAGGHYRWAADILRDGRYWSRIMAARR
jgi:hypothetical protein